MKRIVLLLAVVLVFCCGTFAFATDEYTLEDYNLTLDLPEGWSVFPSYMTSDFFRDTDAASDPLWEQVDEFDTVLVSETGYPAFSLRTVGGDPAFYGIYNLEDASPEQVDAISGLFEEALMPGFDEVHMGETTIAGTRYLRFSNTQASLSRMNHSTAYATIKNGESFGIIALAQENSYPVLQDAQETLLKSIRYGENQYPVGIAVVSIVTVSLCVLMTLVVKKSRRDLRDLYVTTKQYNSGLRLRGGTLCVLVFMFLMLFITLPVLDLGAQWLFILILNIVAFVLIGLKNKAFRYFLIAAFAADAVYLLYSFQYSNLCVLIMGGGFSLWHAFLSRRAMIYFRTYRNITLTDTGQVYTIKKSTTVAERSRPVYEKNKAPQQTPSEQSSPAYSCSFHPAPAQTQQHESPVGENRPTAVNETMPAPPQEAMPAPLATDQAESPPVPIRKEEASASHAASTAPKAQLTQAPTYSRPDLSSPVVTRPKEADNGPK